MSVRLFFSTRKMQKNAQVTVFIVVGLVLLGIAGILISLSDSLKTDSLTQITPQDERVKFDAAVKIIRDCITTSTQKSLVAIALQGGAITEDIAIPISSLSGQTQDSFVSVGITRRDDELRNPTTKSVELGEIRPAPIDPLQNQQIKTLGGKLTLPALCDRFGPNKASNPVVGYTCESYDLEGKSIQNRLVAQIQADTIACAQKSEELLDDIGQDVSTYFGIAPQVIFGESDVTVDFKFDTNVSIRKSNFSFHEATVKIPARYKDLYNFLYAVLFEDSKEILFDKTTQYNQADACYSRECWKKGFTLSVTRGIFIDPDTGKVFDLVSVTDTNSSIGGKPLTFRTAIENRRPVIDPLSIYDVFSFPAVTTYPDPSDWERRYTTYAKSGQTISLRPVAYDFDEETNLDFTYVDWKASEDSLFDTGSFSNQNGGCSSFSSDEPNYPVQCEYWNDEYVSTSVISSNKWHDSADYVLGSDGCNGEINRCASYTTTQDGTDLGAHSVTILVKDRAGLSDAVDAAILVGTD